MYPYVHNRGNSIGGIVGYPLEQLRREVAVLAFHFHWSYETIMEMEHQERCMWVREIGAFLDQ
jgi:membrane protein YqaA with SNARE-associated domain